MKLLSYNIWIKIDNSKKVWDFIKNLDPDIVLFQENLRHFDDSVFGQYKSDYFIKKIIWEKYPYSFFWPVWLSDKIVINNKVIVDFNWFVEQGNEIISKFEIVQASNNFFYWNYERKFNWDDFKQNDHSRAILVSQVNINWKKVQIINIHWPYSKDKLDSERSILLVETILDIAWKNDLPTIIAGDFNLFPSTKSIWILNTKFINLITEYNISSTRPSFKDDLDEWNNIIDYIFVDDKIKVNSFEVINTNISDHLPLILDFEVL